MAIRTDPKKDEYMNRWDEVGGHFLQSWQWGDVKKGEWEVHRLLVDNYPLTIITRGVPVVGGRFGYIPRAFGKKNLTPELITEVRDFAQKELKLTHLIVEPDLADNDASLQLFIENGAKPSGRTIQPNYTNIIDLRKSEEELWSEVRSSNRRNINKSTKRFACETEIHKDGGEAIDRFNEVNSSLETRNKFVKHPTSYFKKVWEEFSPVGMATILIVKSEGKDVAAYFNLHNSTTLFELYGGTLESGKPIGAGHLLKWESIKHAKSIGLETYDQWGVAEYFPGDEVFDRKDPLYFVSEFKFGFGGEYFRFSSQYTFAFDMPKYLAFKGVERLNTVRLFLLKYMR